jgi:hypothetical protein
MSSLTPAPRLAHTTSSRHAARREDVRRRRARRRRALRVARAGLVGALEGAAVVAIVVVVRHAPDAPAEPAAPLTAATIAADPAHYRSREVQIRGAIIDRPTRVAAKDDGAFVLASGHGGRLLVVAADDADLLTLRVGTVVLVDGTVVVPPDSKRLADRATSRTAVARRAGAPALVKATRVRPARSAR